MSHVVFRQLCALWGEVVDPFCIIIHGVNDNHSCCEWFQNVSDGTLEMKRES